MKKMATHLATVPAALGLLIAPAAVAPAAAQTTEAEDVTLTLFAVEEDATFITRTGEVLDDDEEQEETLPAVGDRFVATEALYADEERTELAGRNHISCMFTEVVGDFPTEEPTDLDDLEGLEDFRLTFMCSGVVQVFGQGDLAWSGATTFTLDDLIEEFENGVDLDEPFITVAITGGTQELIGATGQVDIFDEESDDEDEVLSRYEVTLL